MAWQSVGGDDRPLPACHGRLSGQSPANFGPAPALELPTTLDFLPHGEKYVRQYFLRPRGLQGGSAGTGLIAWAEEKILSQSPKK
jgi:hypothetical protein